MAEAFVLVVLLVAVAIAIPLTLWIGIANGTSNPTLVDRAEAERIAQERGGRGSPGSDPDSSRCASAAHGHADDHEEDLEWGTESDDLWGTRSDDSDRDERWW